MEYCADTVKAPCRINEHEDQMRAAEWQGKTAGRPRRLTTEQLLETAIAIGLEGLTMSAVARRLGVSITVLYGYVSSREELVRLAASYALEQHQYPEDDGQHWSVYVAQYAVVLEGLLTGPGQLIGQFFGGARDRRWKSTERRHG